MDLNLQDMAVLEKALLSKESSLAVAGRERTCVDCCRLLAMSSSCDWLNKRISCGLQLQFCCFGCLCVLFERTADLCKPDDFGLHVYIDSKEAKIVSQVQSYRSAIFGNEKNRENMRLPPAHCEFSESRTSNLYLWVA